MFIKTLTVSEVNKYLKKTFDNDFILNNIHIKGEISNLKIHNSGHIYFSLKDNYGKINCIMFRSNAENLKFLPENGMKVTTKGRISVYEKEGLYQLYCEDMQEEGVGQLYIQFQQMKNKLENEGLFEESHKRNIPKYPRRIGVITSPTGAAVRDIINVSKRRNKNVQLLIYPSLVQGEKASENIIEGINVLNSMEDIDIIILARGGGSIEELWAFNEEKLAYAVYNSKKPIVTGVGHETDFTIVDFVSDMRASTPSAAAEVSVLSLEELNSRIRYNKDMLNKFIENYIDNNISKVDLLNKSLKLNSPENYIVNQYKHIDNLSQILDHKLKFKLSIEKERLSKQYALLSSNNPLNVLNKGYSIIQNDKNEIVNEVDKIKRAQFVNITLKDGKVKANLNILEVKHGT